MDRRSFIINSIMGTCALCKGLSCFAQEKVGAVESVRLEACTLCQLRCPACWRITAPERFNYGYLKFNNYKKFVDKYNIRKVSLAQQGEIFLNPELDKIIKYSYEKGIQLDAQEGVNGNDISDKVAKYLVKYNFGKISFSIDGITQDSYEKYRVGGNLEKVLENINKIKFYKRKYRSNNPELVWQFIVFGHNEHEIPKAKELSVKWEMPLSFMANWAPTFSPIKNVKWCEEQTGLNFDSRPEMFLDWFLKNPTNNYYCTDLLRRPAIMFDGELFGCCVASNYMPMDKLNVFKDGYIEALNGDKVTRVRKWLAGEDVKVSDLPCAKCDIYPVLKRRGVKITQ